MLLFLLSFTVGLVSPSIADAAPTQKDKSAKRMQILMLKLKQDMEAEKLALLAQFDAEKKVFAEKQLEQDESIAAVNQKVNLLEKKNSQLSSDVKKLTLDKAKVETAHKLTQEELASTKISLSEQKQINQQAQADLKFNDNQRKTLASNLSDTTKAVNACEAKNVQLHQFGSDL